MWQRLIEELWIELYHGENQGGGIRDLFGTFAKFIEKLTFHIPWDGHKC